MDLHGKTALVTGGARRVGRAIGLELARAGANVVVHCRSSRAEAEATCTAVRACGVGAAVVAGDLRSASDVSRIADEAEATFGTVDVLVNNASTFSHTPIEMLSADTWDHVLSVNLKGPFLLAVRLGKAMRGRDGGAIVNIGDWAALRPYRGYLPYCVSKAGIVALTTGLAKALAPKVRVNCVAPGPVLPPEDYTAAERAQLMQLTPLQRLGSPEDVARMVRFLVTEADFSTGGVYLVDGGRLNAQGIWRGE
jgi:pteridine reductase